MNCAEKLFSSGFEVQLEFVRDRIDDHEQVPGTVEMVAATLESGDAKVFLRKNTTELAVPWDGLTTATVLVVMIPRESRGVESPARIGGPHPPLVGVPRRAHVVPAWSTIGTDSGCRRYSSLRRVG